MKIRNTFSSFLSLIIFSTLVFSQSGRDVSGSEVDVHAFRAENSNFTTVEFNVYVNSTDFNGADGVRFSFPEGTNILNAFIDSEMVQGVNPIIQNNEVVFGSELGGSTAGIFMSDYNYTFIVHIDASAQAPIDIGYVIYDDGWAQAYCIEEENCEICNDYGFGIDCNGEVLSYAVNAEGIVVIDSIDILQPPNQGPVILDLSDIENDQGKQMMLSWMPGDLMDLPYFTQFSVHRYNPGPNPAFEAVDGVFYGEYFSAPGPTNGFGELMFSREDSVINFNFDTDPLPVNDYFQIRWTGKISAPVSGMYNFRTHSDDGVRLFVDGQLVIDAWGIYPPTSNYGSVDLAQGPHDIVLEYFENNGGAEVGLYWTPPGSDEGLVRPVGAMMVVNDQGTWDYLSTVPWHGMEPYASVVSTLEDKVPTVFKVTAHTEDPNQFFHSEPVQGRSYDNIAPLAPMGLVAEVTGSAVTLNWSPSGEEDFNFYSIHRGLDTQFQPGMNNRILFSVSPMAVDSSASANDTLFYKVRAADFGGNFSPGSAPSSAYIAVNRPPSVVDVALNPALPMGGDSIIVTYTFVDPDGDLETGTVFTWYKNGVIESSQTSSSVPAAATACNDEWYVVVTPNDGTLSGSPAVSNTVVVCGANTPPVWSELPPINIDEDSQNNIFEMAELVSDDQQAVSQLSFSVYDNTNPGLVGASFDGSRLMVSALTQNYFSSSAATLTLRVSDGSEISDGFVVVNIQPVNDSPIVIDYNGPDNFNEDESYHFEIYDFVIEDPDNDIVELTMNVLPGENYMASMDTPGLINTPPNYNGNIVVHVEIKDAMEGATVTMVPLTVNAVNDAAFLVTSGVDVINNGPATEEQEYSLSLEWKDPDGTQDVTVYNLELGGPASNWLGVDNIYSSGEGMELKYNAILKGTPDDMNMPENDISISIVDNSEGETEVITEYFYIATIPVNDAPMIESYNGIATIDEDESIVFSIDKFAVDDPDNSPIDFTVSVLAGDNYLVGSDGITVHPADNYNGDLSVNISVSDGDKTDDIAVVITVLPVNDVLVLNSVSDGNATEEVAYSQEISWTDVDGNDASSYVVSLYGAASAWLNASDVTYNSDRDQFSVNIAGTPDDQNLNENNLSITITDNSEGAPISLNTYLSINIVAVNDDPVVSNYTGPDAVDEDNIFIISLNDFVVDDVDNDFPFDFYLQVLEGDNYVVNSDGKSITPAQDFNGTLSVNVSISDGEAATNYAITVFVSAINDAPVLNAYLGSTSFDEDTELTLTGSDFLVSDPDDGNMGDYNVNINENQNYSVSFDGRSIIPDENYNGSLSVTANVVDLSGAESNSLTFDLIVAPVNDAPTIANLAVSPAIPTIDDDLTVTYTFEDVDGDFERLSQIQWYKNGQAQTDVTGPTVDDSLTACDEEWYAIVIPNDGTTPGQSYTTNSVTICGANTAPVWSWTDPVLLEEDGVIEIDMYSQMNDAEHAPSQIVYSIVSQTGGDKVAAAISGQMLTLTATELNYNGDNVTNIVINAYDGGYNVETTVVVNITPVNDKPIAQDDNYWVDEGGTVTSVHGEPNQHNLLENDSDVDGDVLQIELVDNPVNGTLQINADNSFTYTHDGGETTSDSFTYMATDGELSSDLATATFTINPVNDPPVIVYAASFETLENQSFDITIDDLIFEDPDSDPAILVFYVSEGDNYTSEPHPAPSGHTITPDLNYSGQLVIPITASDGQATSDIFEVYADVIGVNDAPEVVTASSDISVNEDADPVLISLLGSTEAPYFTDSDGDDLNFMAYTKDGMIAHTMIDNDTLHVSFEPDAFGEDSLFVTATDVSGAFAEDTILISVASVNDAPVITTSAYFVIEEEDSFNVSLDDFVYYDIDSHDSSLTLVLEDGDGYSIESIDTGYKVTADPDVSDTLYIPSTISDGDSLSNIWNLMVIVLPSNDAPEVVNAAEDVNVLEDAENVFINLMGSVDAPYFADSDGDTLSFSAWTTGSGVVSAMVDFHTLELSFIPNMYGVDTVHIIATDPAGDSAEDMFVVTVTSVNDAPLIVSASSFEVLEDDSLDIILSNFVLRDMDTPEDSLTIEVSLSNHYQLLVIDQGYRVFPNLNFFGDVPMVVLASDGEAVSDSFNTVLSVLPVNDEPEIINPLADITAEEDADSLVINLMGSADAPYFSDVDGDTLSFMAYTDSSNVVDVMVDNHHLVVHFIENMNGNDNLYISGTDGSGVFIVDSVMVSVTAVNDAPDEFSLISPEDSAVVTITNESIIQNAAIEVSWEMSFDVEGDSIGYGFVLYAGPYSETTPALYEQDVDMNNLSIPHAAILTLLQGEPFGNVVSGDWMVFATDGMDTTYSTEMHRLTIDAGWALSTDDLLVPEEFALHQNYPNPFNPTTNIKYDLPEAGIVEISIFDLMGRKIRTLVNGHQDIGFRNIRWDATDNYGKAVSAGMYIYTIQAGDFRQVRKMILLK